MNNRKKAGLWVLLWCLILTYPVKADEGMWIPLMLEKLIGDMQEKGFELTAEDIYSVNRSSMKDAVIWFGRGCTGEVISAEGLILTNHHCGYGSIQSHSTVENDLLTDGFWAMNRGQEIPNPGLTVTFIISMADVTDQVLAGVQANMSESARSAVINRNMQAIREKAVQGTHYEALVRDFYYGNKYYLFLTETFRDIRLVGAPPSSIGKFGGDTDNWMWPRHTGDFAVFRIYAGPDNKPADYSEANVPFKPRHHFPISLAPINEGDFAMIYGFPGSTQHFLPAQAVEHVQHVSNPVKIGMRETSLALMDSYMQKSDKVRIQNAARYARISNYYKKWIGENTGLRSLDAVNVKKAYEEEYLQRAEGQDPAFAKALHQLNQLYTDFEKYGFARDLFVELVFYGPLDLRFIGEFRQLAYSYEELRKQKKLDNELQRLENLAKSHFKDYHGPLERELLAALMAQYLSQLDPQFYPEIFEGAKADPSSFDYQTLADALYDGSIFTQESLLMAMLQDFRKKSATNILEDPFFQFVDNLYAIYGIGIQPKYQQLSGEIDAQMREYIRGRQALFPEAKQWPDANSTLRISYGSVTGSSPRDGMSYRHYSTLEGVMQKQETGVAATHEFYVPEKLVTLYRQKDYGPYAQDGELWVCFTASHHTTGGNSGSPIINGKGHLIGINFDRSWESTMSDLMYDPDRCRNIAVDIRYVLFIIDKFAGASHLLDEMTLVQPE